MTREPIFVRIPKPLKKWLTIYAATHGKDKQDLVTAALLLLKAQVSKGNKC